MNSPLSTVTCPRCGHVRALGVVRNLLRFRWRAAGLAAALGGVTLCVLFFLRSLDSESGRAAHHIAADRAQSALALIGAICGWIMVRRKSGGWRCPSCGSENGL